MISKTQNSPLMPGKKQKKSFTESSYLEKCWNHNSSFHRNPLTGKIMFFPLQKPLDVTNHSVAREVVTFFTLPPGEYIVMPQTNVIFFSFFWFPLPGDWVTFNILIWCCQVPNCDGKFLLRILTDEQSNIWWAWQDNQIKSWLFRLLQEIKEIMNRLAMIYFES